jgi:hypothetical protein
MNTTMSIDMITFVVTSAWAGGGLIQVRIAARARNRSFVLRRVLMLLPPSSRDEAAERAAALQKM